MKMQSHVLIADDHEDTRYLLTQLLDGEFHVTSAAGGLEAIECIERDRPDLLILDLLMPGVDGFAVLAHLAAHPGPFLPVIVRSATTQRKERLQALKMGAHEFLGSPFDEEELGVRIHNMLALKEARETVERRALELEVTVAERTHELQLALEDLRRTNRYKEEFLSVISHELRTPLGFIIACASSLEDGVVGQLSDQQLGLIEKISLGGNRMIELVNNLLDMSLMATGKLVLDSQPECYAPLVEQAIEAMSALAAGKNIQLTVEVRVPDTVVLDGRRTVQVLTNLIQNAVKFTPVGGRVSVSAYIREDQLVTEVTDNGIGIGEDDVPKLFFQFKQLDMSSTRVAGGSGLGLSLSKAIVEAHGGTIGVRSELDVGSTFWFSLPLTPVHATHLKDAAPIGH